jgi:hypothetical protein
MNGISNFAPRTVGDQIFDTKIQPNTLPGFGQWFRLPLAYYLKNPTAGLPQHSTELDNTLDVSMPIEPYPSAHCTRCAEIGIANPVGFCISKLQSMPAIGRFETWETFLDSPLFAATKEIRERLVKPLEGSIHQHCRNLRVFLGPMIFVLSEQIQMLACGFVVSN